MGSARLLMPKGGRKAPMPPLDKKPDQLPRPYLEKVNITVKDTSQRKLNTEDKTTHNSPLGGRVYLNTRNA